MITTMTCPECGSAEHIQTTRQKNVYFCHHCGEYIIVKSFLSVPSSLSEITEMDRLNDWNIKVVAEPQDTALAVA